MEKLKLIWQQIQQPAFWSGVLSRFVETLFGGGDGAAKKMALVALAAGVVLSFFSYRIGGSIALILLAIICAGIFGIGLIAGSDAEGRGGWYAFAVWVAYLVLIGLLSALAVNLLRWLITWLVA